MNFRKLAICTVLVALMLSTFVLIQPALAKPKLPESQDIPVQQAYDMIKHESKKDPVIILDVRNESEYNLGHLYDAVLIPSYELDDRISELAANQNDAIIVYCKAGSRSAQACQILSEHGFTRVYNMLGGITAWMQANYPIDTSYHYITIDTKNNGKTQIDIEPFLLYQVGCTTCNQGCPNSNATNITNSSVTVLDDSATHSKLLISYIQNDALIQLTVEKNLIWKYDQFQNGLNRTITFVSTMITDGNTTRQLYGLADFVQTSKYNMTLITGLDPLDSETYNASITIMSYVPLGKNETLSAEKVDFNSSVTLSQQYSLLSQVSRKLGNEYGKSPDETLNVFAERYYTIASEFAFLSQIVKTNLHSYDHEILRSTAVITDDFWSCLACQIGLNALIGGGCILLCIFTGGLACGICLSYGWAIRIILGMGIGAFCAWQGYCP